jgi:hypothetical protein
MLAKVLFGIGGLALIASVVVWAWQSPSATDCCAASDPTCCPQGPCCGDAAAKKAAQPAATPAEGCTKDCCGACCTDEECYWCRVLGCDVCCAEKSAANQPTKGCCTK